LIWLDEEASCLLCGSGGRAGSLSAAADGHTILGQPAAAATAIARSTLGSGGGNHVYSRPTCFDLLKLK
jgi:hypothetical protein